MPKQRHQRGAVSEMLLKASTGWPRSGEDADQSFTANSARLKPIRGPPASMLRARGKIVLRVSYPGAYLCQQRIDQPKRPPIEIVFDYRPPCRVVKRAQIWYNPLDTLKGDDPLVAENRALTRCRPTQAGPGPDTKSPRCPSTRPRPNTFDSVADAPRCSRSEKRATYTPAS
jgi:hypothetical protein